MISFNELERDAWLDVLEDYEFSIPASNIPLTTDSTSSSTSVKIGTDKEDSSEEPDLETPAKRKRTDDNNAKPARLPQLRAGLESEVIKYPFTLINYVNKGDKTSMVNFLRKTCTDDCKLTTHDRQILDLSNLQISDDIRNTSVSSDPSMGRMTGTSIDTTISAWEHSLSMWPDGHLIIKAAKLRLVNGQAALVCAYTFSGTQLYVVDSVRDETGQVVALKQTDEPLMIKDVEDDGETLATSKKLKGTLTISLTYEGKINSFHFYYSFVNSREKLRKETSSCSSSK